jgi:2-keto-4-pentenoate hydratase/2-oxohepta-3-ene-1,7-dioic acid hydratase in catechol pathway
MDKIICVGKNYLKHALELGDAVPEEPLYFLKPPSTIFFANNLEQKIELPTRGEIHHELELVLMIAKTRTGWEFSHYTFGLDLTIRDLQSRLKKAGQPWEKAKVFKNSAVLGPWQRIDSLESTLEIPFDLKVNGERRQHAQGKDMRFQPRFLLDDVARWFPLIEGDIMFTGTPEGVGEMKRGDRLEIQGGKVQYSITCA